MGAKRGGGDDDAIEELLWALEALPLVESCDVARWRPRLSAIRPASEALEAPEGLLAASALVEAAGRLTFGKSSPTWARGQAKGAPWRGKAGSCAPLPSKTCANRLAGPPLH